MGTSAEFSKIREMRSGGEFDATATKEQLEVLSTLLSDPSAGPNVLDSIPLSAIFACFRSSNRSLIAATCSVLKKLLPMLDIVQVSQTLLEYMPLALADSADEVRQLFLAQLLRCAENEQFCVALFEAENSVAITQTLKDATLSSHKPITQLLCRAACRHEACAKALLSPESPHCQTLVSIVSGGKDEMRFRVFSLVVEIASYSPALLKLCADAGLLPRLVSELSRG